MRSSFTTRLEPRAVRNLVSTSSLPTIEANVPLAGVDATQFCPNLVYDNSPKRRCLQDINAWDNGNVAITAEEVPAVVAVASTEAAASVQAIVYSSDANGHVQVKLGPELLRKQDRCRVVVISDSVVQHLHELGDLLGLKLVW